MQQKHNMKGTLRTLYGFPPDVPVHIHRPAPHRLGGRRTDRTDM